MNVTEMFISGVAMCVRLYNENKEFESHGSLSRKTQLWSGRKQWKIILPVVKRKRLNNARKYYARFYH